MTNTSPTKPLCVAALLVDLVPHLTRRIRLYHEMFSQALQAEQWEEVLARSFQDVGIQSTWTPTFSHKIGEDMRLCGFADSRISCKSGQLSNSMTPKRKCVKFNGGRSTKFVTLEEKLAHFSASHDDYYFLLSKNPKFDRTYKLIVFPSSLCRVNALEWTMSVKGNAWNGLGEFNATISKAMSDQLWTTLPLDMIEHIHDIDCSNC